MTSKLEKIKKKVWKEHFNLLSYKEFSKEWYIGMLETAIKLTAKEIFKNIEKILSFKYNPETETYYLDFSDVRKGFEKLKKEWGVKE